jgi:hypothetical protein
MRVSSRAGLYLKIAVARERASESSRKDQGS